MNQPVRLANAARNASNPWPVRLACGAAAIYLILPFDFLPDIMPVIGWIDDLLVILGVIMWVVNRRKAQPAQK